MKEFLVILVVAVFGIYMFGCAKKEALEESQETMSMDALTSPNVQVAATEGRTVEAIQATGLASPKIESVSLAKPSPKEIQSALKNAGYYKGAIDGKIGPMSKKAIDDFQRDNGLEVDGKVGRRTWEVLSKQLDTAAQAAR